MFRALFIAVLVLAVLAHLEPALGTPREANESDEVTLLQLSKNVAIRTGSSSAQLPHTAAAPRKANNSEAPKRPAVKEVNRDLSLLQERPPPSIMLVLLIAIALSAATAVMYYAGLLFCQSLPPEIATARANIIDWIACSLGIMISLCSYGIAQEYIMTQLYGDERFPSVPFLILCNHALTVTVAAFVLLAYREALMLKPALWTVIPGATNMVSSFCQYDSLHFVTFPTQVVFKSAKIVPTMILNTAVNSVRQRFSDYLQGIIITFCVVGFTLLTEKASADNAQSDTVVGLIMLIMFLLGDAFTSNGEKLIYTRYPEFSTTQMMFAMGIVDVIYSSVLTAITDGGYPVMLAFIQKHPECLSQIFALSVFSMAGQYLIFYIIQKHGPVVMAIMLSERQILSIFLSAALYGHVIPMPAILLAALCFVVILATPIYQWWYSSPKDVS